MDALSFYNYGNLLSPLEGQISGTTNEFICSSSEVFRVTGTDLKIPTNTVSIGSAGIMVQVANITKVTDLVLEEVFFVLVTNEGLFKYNRKIRANASLRNAPNGGKIFNHFYISTSNHFIKLPHNMLITSIFIYVKGYFIPFGSATDCIPIKFSSSDLFLEK